MNLDLLDELRAALDSGERVALVTIVAARGSTPQRVGAKMLVHADGRTAGTIGGGCYENDALGKAREAIRRGRPEMVRYDLTDDFVEESGLICGGQMEVFIEPLEPPPMLVILGAGHVGHELGRLAPGCGFSVTVVDDREKFASAARFPAAASVVVDEIPAWVAGTALPPTAYVVVVTRGHRHDFDALRALAGRDLRYVGVIGSRAKVARTMDALVEAGVEVDWLRRVRAPIGLAIGAVTPEEIAVSILAELIATRRGAILERSDAPEAMQWHAPALRTGGAAPAR